MARSFERMLNYALDIVREAIYRQVADNQLVLSKDNCILACLDVRRGARTDASAHYLSWAATQFRPIGASTAPLCLRSRP